MGRPAEVHVARAPDADISRNGQSATSVGGEDVLEVRVGDVAHEAHPVRDARSPRRAPRSSVATWSRPSMAEPDEEAPARRPAGRASASSTRRWPRRCRHVAEQRDDAPAVEAEGVARGRRGRAARGRSSTKWGTTLELDRRHEAVQTPALLLGVDDQARRGHARGGAARARRGRASARGGPAARRRRGASRPSARRSDVARPRVRGRPPVRGPQSASFHWTWTTSAPRSRARGRREARRAARRAPPASLSMTSRSGSRRAASAMMRP